MRTNIDNHNEIKFLNGLLDWVRSSPETEAYSRYEAMTRIVSAMKNKETFLKLDGLELTSIPKEISYLTNLESLDLSKNKLTSIPEEIGVLTALTGLSLCQNQLTSFPSEILNLNALTQLDLSQNRIRSIPAEIFKLYHLQGFDVSENQITSIPEEIGNLTALIRLNFNQNLIRLVPAQISNLIALEELGLEENKITSLPEEMRNLVALKVLVLGNNLLETIPHALLSFEQEGERNISLEYNRISPEECVILIKLASNNGVVLEISADYSQMPVQKQRELITEVTNKILSQSESEEFKQELQTFVESSGLDNFKSFLSRCPQTEGWNSHEAEMTQCLFEIVKKMSQSEAIKTKCESLAETAYGSCGDRVALAFVQMQLSLNLSDKKVEEMSVREVYDYAKQESVIKFLSEKSEAKIKQIKDSQLSLDKIEVHLAYMQIGQALGLPLKANGMLYKTSSNVTPEELEVVKKEFLLLDRERLIVEHTCTDNILRLHPFVQEIIKKVGNEDRFDIALREGENESDYLKRLESLQKDMVEEQIREISKVFKKELTASLSYKEESGEEEVKLSVSKSTAGFVHRIRDLVERPNTAEQPNTPEGNPENTTRRRRVVNRLKTAVESSRKGG